MKEPVGSSSLPLLSSKSVLINKTEYANLSSILCSLPNSDENPSPLYFYGMTNFIVFILFYWGSSFILKESLASVSKWALIELITTVLGHHEVTVFSM